MKAKKYLKGGQVKLDANKDGKISGKDFSMLRKGMKKYQKGGKAPKGEIDLGKGSYKGMTLSDAEELNRRVGENYGKHASDIRTGYKGLDSRMDETESERRQAFARAGGKYYDGDGGAAGRRKKAYADRLEARTDLKIRMEKHDAKTKAKQAEDRKKGMKAVDTYNKSSAKMKSGGKVVKYQEGGSNPTPTERTYTGDDRRQITSSGNQPGADYKGYNKTKTPKEVLEGSEMRRLKAALQKNKYGTNGMSLADMRKVTKTKGIYDEARKLARQDYSKEMAKRR